MNYIIILTILIGCSKISFENKNKDYEEISLNISELVLAAIHNSDLQLLEHYLSSIDNINRFIGERGTFLHAASEIGNLVVIKRLLELGADPLIKNSYNKYVYEITNDKEVINLINSYTESINEKLALAIDKSHTDEAIKFINKGANPNYIYNDKSILEIAIDKKNLKLINKIIERNAKVNKEDLINIYDISLDEFDYELITNLVKNNYELKEGEINDKKYFLLLCAKSNAFKIKDFIKKSKIDPKNIMDKSFKNGLIIATFFNKIDTLKMLVEDYRLNINQKDENGFSPLILSSSLGHFEIVKFLIDNGANVNEGNNDGFTPLILASKNGHLKVVDLLIKNGANVNSGNYYGFTPLISASQNGHKEIIELLVENGANVNGRGRKGFTPLISASQNGHLEVVKFLLKNGSNVNNETEDDKDTALILAAKNGHKEIVGLLSKKVANIDDKNKKGNTALILASKNGHLETVKLLVKSGANIHDKNSKGNTALILAAKNGHLAIVEFLLQKGVDVNIKNNLNQTSLILASENGHLEVVELFLNNNSDFIVRDNYGFTAIMASVRNGHENIFKILLEKGAELNEKEKNGFTLLHLVSIKGNKTLALFLIDRGFNVNEKSSDGFTPLMLASKNGCVDVSNLLLQKGASVNDRSDYGFTSLILASLNGHLEIVKLLLQKGANFYAKANNGYTALNVAREKGHKEIEKLLIEKGADNNEENILFTQEEDLSLLIIATFLGDIDKVKDLIENGVDINETSGEKTALDIALKYKKQKIAKFLASKGCKRYKELSIEIKKEPFVYNTYNYKINSDYKDKDGNSFLHYAAFFNNIKLLKEVLKNGYDINCKNFLGQTPLEIVLGCENLDQNFVIYLIRKGAILNFESEIKGIPLIDFISNYDDIYNFLIFYPFLKKIFKDINLSDVDKDNLKNIIKILKVTKEDLNSENKKLMFEFIKDMIKFEDYKKIQSLNVCDVNTLSIIDNSTDVNLNIDVFVSILSNFTTDDFEKNIRDEGIKNIKKRFIERLKDVEKSIPISQLNKPQIIHNASKEELKIYEADMKKYNLECIKFNTKKQLYKLGLLISQASLKDKSNIKWAINIILEQLVCPVGTLEAIKYAIKCLMQQDDNNDLKDTLSNEIMQFRIDLIQEIAKEHLHNKIQCISEIGRGLAEYNNHMLAYLVMDLSRELKVDGLHENEFKYEYDRKFVVNEVKRLYNERFIKYLVEMVKNDNRLSNLVRTYLENEIFKTSKYLIIEDFIHDDDLKIKDNVIKILLMYFGYLK